MYNLSDFGGRGPICNYHSACLKECLFYTICNDRHVLLATHHLKQCSNRDPTEWLVHQEASRNVVNPHLPPLLAK